MNLNCLHRSVHIVHSCFQHASMPVLSITCVSNRRAVYSNGSAVYPTIDVLRTDNMTSLDVAVSLVLYAIWPSYRNVNGRVTLLVIPSSSSELLSRDPIEAMDEKESTAMAGSSRTGSWCEQDGWFTSSNNSLGGDSLSGMPFL